MARIVDDMSGQWILLSGLTISMALILVAALVNQAAITGYYSSYAALEFPKEQIRELTSQTHESAIGAAQRACALSNTSNESVRSNFTAILNNYTAQVSMLYAAHGETINITLSNVIFNSTSCIDVIWLNISYNDGSTKFASEPEVIEVKQ
jgi:hypothetical protein